METAATDRVRDAALTFARQLGTCLRVIIIYSKDGMWRAFTVVSGDVLEQRELEGLCIMGR